MKRNTIKLADFIDGYIECAMWANLLMYQCEHGEDAYTCGECDIEEIEPELVSADLAPGELDESDLTDDALAKVRNDCRDFVAANILDLMASGLDSSQCGHDFALTRCGHGAGFWDHYSKSTPQGEACERLTKACKAFGEQSFVLGADGKAGIL